MGRVRGSLAVVAGALIAAATLGGAALLIWVVLRVGNGSTKGTQVRKGERMVKPVIGTGIKQASLASGRSLGLSTKTLSGSMERCAKARRC